MTEDKKHELEEKILETLRKASKPLPPQEIAHLVGFLRPYNQAATVNPTLWKLLERDEILRTTTEDGKKPHYSISATMITDKAANG